LRVLVPSHSRAIPIPPIVAVECKTETFTHTAAKLGALK
jgi:hypothetical protein